MRLIKNVAGLTYGTATINPNFQVPIAITYGIITNLCPVTVTINLKLQKLISTYYIIPRDTQLESYSSMELPDGRVLMPNDKMVLLTSDSVDFYMNFEST